MAILNTIQIAITGLGNEPGCAGIYGFLKFFLMAKSTMKTYIAVIITLLALGTTWVRAEDSSTVDHTILEGLLAKHVRNGFVDYAGFKADEIKLDQYLSMLERIDPESLTRNEQFAFYINAYNSWTIKLILSGYPGVRSIKDLGGLLQSPWQKELLRIHGKTFKLDDIEHKILRPRFKDPRVHFAINCASKSCPPLLAEPYRSETLDAQLNRSTRDFVNNPASYRFEGDTLWVSSIFKWFSGDFNNDPVGFYRKYAEADLKGLLEEKGHRIQVKYLDYDWSLNGT
jgi:hypothetical protein